MEPGIAIDREHNQIDIISSPSLKNIQFGMTKELVLVLLPDVISVEDDDQDEFFILRDCGIHIHFNDDNECSYINAFPDSNISFKGFDFFNYDLDQTFDFVKTYDPNFRMITGGLQSDFLGLILWIDDIDNIISSITLLKFFKCSNT